MAGDGVRPWDAEFEERLAHGPLSSPRRGWPAGGSSAGAAAAGAAASASTSSLTAVGSAGSGGGGGGGGGGSVYGDRFIPVRRPDDDLEMHYELINDVPRQRVVEKRDGTETGKDLAREELYRNYHNALRSEFFDVPPGASSPAAVVPGSPMGASAAAAAAAAGEAGAVPGSENGGLPVTAQRRLFQYSSPLRSRPAPMDSPVGPAYQSSPLKAESQALLSTPRRTLRTIPRTPMKVLDAPELQDDFYLNLVDWSSTNLLAVGLARSVYLWNANTGKVTLLHQFPNQGDEITSVGWMQRGTHLAVGTDRGEVHIWDVNRSKPVRRFTEATARVGCLAWNGSTLSAGSRSRCILHYDVRQSSGCISRLEAHRQEVCGLKWSPDGRQLASGGNDNRLNIWQDMGTVPLHSFREHQAAVKAIAWSPHQSNLLASGGGTADRCIRFWNTLSGTPLSVVDTGSQVCNLAWSKSANELVSTHGYSQHQVVVWTYPSMQPLATLTGHTSRVLYLAVSPDGQTVVTGAGDETLRFWNVFAKARTARDTPSIFTDLSSQVR